MKEEKEKYIPVALRKDFTKEYTVIDLSAEYPGYRDDIPYAIVTELSEDAFEAKFGKGIDEFRPYVLLNKAMYKEMVMSGLNDERERLRDLFYHDAFAMESAIELIDEYSNPVRICESLFTLDEIFKRLRDLPDNEGSRVYRHYVIGFTIKEIAEQDRVYKSAIYQSIYVAMPKVHDIFVELGVVA